MSYCRTAELDQHQTGSVYLSSVSLSPQFSTTMLVMRSGAFFWNLNVCDIFDYCELICCRLKSEKRFCLVKQVVCDFCNKKSKSVEL